MARSDIPLKPLLQRLLQIGKPYFTLVVAGALCMALCASGKAATMKLITPIFNIANKTENAGYNSFKKIKEFTTPLESTLHLQSLGKKLQSQLPRSWIIDKKRPHKNYVLLTIIFCGLCLAIFIAIFQYLSYRITHYVSLKALTDVKDHLNDVLIRQRFSFYDQFKPGELMSRIQNDTETMSKALIFIYNQGPKGIITIMSGFVYCSYSFPKLTIGLVLLPIFVLPLKKLGKKIKRSSKATLAKRAELTDVMHQQFGGIQEIKGHNLENERQKMFSETNKGVFEGLMGIVSARAKSRGIVEGGGYLAVLILVIGSIFLIDNNSTFGSFAEFMGVVAMLIWTPLRTLSKAYNDFQNSLPGVNNVLDILDHPHPTPIAEHPIKMPATIDSVRFCNVDYRYATGPNVLSQISFEANKGQIIALVGHTGSGKSSLITLLPRFRDPISGSIFINNHDLKEFDLKELRENIALVNQDPYLFNTSIRENLLMGRKNASDEELWEALHKAQLDNFIEDKKEGLDFSVGERGNNLSGGQKQRLAIARAILKDAPILILDEATSSQDNITEKQIQEALSQLMAGRTTFVIAHRLSTIHHADLILILKEGKIVEQGTHEDLKDRNGEYAKLYQTQFKDISL